MNATVGVMAAVCTTIAAAPQLVYLVKRKQTANLSLATQTLNFLGGALWMTYGFLQNDPILYIECAIVTVIYLCIVLIIVRDRCSTKVAVPSKKPNDLPYSE